MYTVPRFLRSGLGGDPRDNVRALEAIRGCRMGKQEADAWMDIFQGADKEASQLC